MLQCTEYKQVRPKWADISRCVRNLLKVHKWNKAKRKGGLNKLIVLDRKLVHKNLKWTYLDRGVLLSVSISLKIFECERVKFLST